VRRILLFVALTGWAGCGADKSDSGTSAAVPDIVGRYNVDILGLAGCENDPAWVDTWARGRLDVTGAGTSLTFDFGDGAAFAGTIESDGVFRFNGSFETNGGDLVIAATGDAGVADTDPGDGSQSALSGEFAIVVSQDGIEDCSVNAPFEATELVDFE
jgi:hypothetical protein